MASISSRFLKQSSSSLTRPNPEANSPSSLTTTPSGSQRKLRVVFPSIKSTTKQLDSNQDNCLAIQFHPILPWILRVSQHQLTVISTLIVDNCVFALELPDLDVLHACFFDGDSLEAYSLLPPALVCDCSLNLIVATHLNGLVTIDTTSGIQHNLSSLPSHIQLSGPCLPLSCIHIVVGTSIGTMLAMDVRTGLCSSFTGASKAHTSPITSIVAVSGKPSTQLHRARVVSCCSKGVVALWDVLCATPLAQIGLTILSTLNIKIYDLSYDHITLTLMAGCAGGVYKAWKGPELTPIIQEFVKGYGSSVQTSRGLACVAVDAIFTNFENNQVLIKSSATNSTLMVFPTSDVTIPQSSLQNVQFTQHPWQINNIGVVCSCGTFLIQIDGSTPPATTVPNSSLDRMFYMRGNDLFCIQAAGTNKPSPERLILPLPPSSCGTGSMQMSMHGNYILMSWQDAYVLCDVSATSARIVDGGRGSNCCFFGDLLVLLDSTSSSFQTKVWKPTVSIKSSSKPDFVNILSGNFPYLLVQTDINTARLLKSDKFTVVPNGTFPLPLFHAWTNKNLVALQYPQICQILDCNEMELFCQVYLGPEPVSSLIFHSDFTLISSSCNQIRLSFLSKGGRLDSFILSDRGKRAMPGFIPAIDKARRSSLHAARADQDENNEDAAFSPSPNFVRPWDSLEQADQSVPLPVSRKETCSLVLLGVKSTRLFYLADYKLESLSLEHPMLILGLLASAKMPDRALPWSGVLDAGQPRDDALILLERMGHFNHAARVPGASIWLVLDVCVKHNMAELAWKIFSPKRQKGMENLKNLSLKKEATSLNGVKRLALLLLHGGMKDVLSSLAAAVERADDKRFIQSLLGMPLEGDFVLGKLVAR